MPTISYDSQSLIVDGRRIWLASGSIHYCRVPRELWRSRIRAAKLAGLNCVETCVFWNRHEPMPGKFDFTGDADLRAFVQLISEEGMYCILRPGPFVGSAADMGGLPAWLLNNPDMRLREANGPFLEGCSRYLGAVMEQVRTLQANHGDHGGPIVMVQIENEWFCHHREQAAGYLGELARFLRENGCTVPLSECNNLWQQIDGAISTWNAGDHLAADLRQLGVVQANAPRFVAEFQAGAADVWHKSHTSAVDADQLQHNLAQVLGAGGQFNVHPFHGGTNFAFSGGRTIDSPDDFVTTTHDCGAPLAEGGAITPGYLAVKRIGTFASQFAHVLAHCETRDPHAAISPIGDDHPLCVLHQSGSQGQIIYFLKSAKSKITIGTVMMPSGLELHVPFGNGRVAWMAVDVRLGNWTLTHTNLRPWAFIGGKMLVLFGPAGAEGVINIDDAEWHTTVPQGSAPLVEQHEDLTVVVLNEDQVDSAYVVDKTLIVGAAGLDREGRPVASPGSTMMVIDLDGKTRTIRAQRAERAAPPRLTGWAQAALTSMVDGTDATFKPIAGPASLESLGCPTGYGWYRLALKSAKRGRMLAPQAGDRLHVFTGGKRQAIMAIGADANPVNLNLDKRTIILADNLGRFDAGVHLGEPKGVFGHFCGVKPVRLGKPKVVPGRSPDPFTVRGYVPHMRHGDAHPADALVWTFKSDARRIVLDIRGLWRQAVIFLNDQPIGYYGGPDSAGFTQCVLETAGRGKRELKLAFFDKLNGKADIAAVARCVAVHQVTDTPTEKAEWSFAPWTIPTAETFTGDGKPAAGTPSWFRCEFTIRSTNQPLWLEPKGMSKGQIILNGHNIGRYFLTSTGVKPVSPQVRYFLPEPWLHTDQPNELLLFDEHGKPPTKCRLVHAAGPR